MNSNQNSDQEIPSSAYSYVPVGKIDPASPHRNEDHSSFFSVVVSWVAIASCVLFLAGTFAYSQFVAEPEPVESVPAQASIGLRTSIGMRETFGGAAGEAADVEALNKGPIAQRVTYVIGKGEQDGFEAAAGALQKVRNEIKEASYEPTEKENRLLDSVQHIVDAARLKERENQLDAEDSMESKASVDAAANNKSESGDSEDQAGEGVEETDTAEIPEPVAVSEEELAGDLKLVREKLGIAGELANAWLSDDPADLKKLKTRMRNSTIGITVFGVGVMLAVLLGVVVLIVMIGLLFSGKLQSLMVVPGQSSHIYLEAFAVWITGFVGFQLFVPLVLMFAGVDLKNDAMAGNLATVLIFYTPMFIGVTWMLMRHPQPRQALREAGFQTHGFFSDIAHGLVTYLAFLPIIALSMGLTVLLTQLVWGGHEAMHPFAPDPGPSHPIQNEANGTIFTTIFLYFLAAVSAPIVEEIVFRGLLFRWLRDATEQQGVWVSCFLAAAANSFLFASIHPQGLLGIPPLMTIGFCMSMARHWRGGLIAPMTIHAVHNGSLVTMLTILNL